MPLQTFLFNHRVNRFKFGDEEVNYILQKKGALLDFADGLIEDIFPIFSYFYKSKALRKLEEFSNELMNDFFGKRYEEAKKTFDRSE